MADDDEIDLVVDSIQNRCATVRRIEHIGINSLFVYLKFSSKEAAAQGFHLLNNWRYHGRISFGVLRKNVDVRLQVETSLPNISVSNGTMNTFLKHVIVVWTIIESIVNVFSTFICKQFSCSHVCLLLLSRVIFSSFSLCLCVALRSSEGGIYSRKKMLYIPLSLFLFFTLTWIKIWILQIRPSMNEFTSSAASQTASWFEYLLNPNLLDTFLNAENLGNDRRRENIRASQICLSFFKRLLELI